MFLDIAENYNCSHLDEAQSAHWNYEQVVSHSVVTHYHCPSEGCAKIIYESVVCISEDLRHDYHAVHHYTTLVRQDIMHMIDMEKEIQFLEGAPNQHKGSQLRRLVHVRTGLWVPNREAFWEVPWRQKDHVTTRQVWSRAVHLAVGSHRTIIKNAKQFSYTQKQPSLDPKLILIVMRKALLFFVTNGDILRDWRNRLLRASQLHKVCMHFAPCNHS